MGAGDEAYRMLKKDPSAFSNNNYYAQSGSVDLIAVAKSMAYQNNPVGYTWGVKDLFELSLGMMHKSGKQGTANYQRIEVSFGQFNNYISNKKKTTL